MGELSGYLLIRTGGLLVLTLVATTLPADAVEPARDAGSEEASTETDAPSGKCPAGTPTPAPPGSPPEGEESSQGAASPDLGQEVFRSAIWSGRDARCSFPGSTPSLLADLLAQTRPAFGDPVDGAELIRIESREPAVQSQRCRLVCRDAHAPPVG